MDILSILNASDSEEEDLKALNTSRAYSETSSHVDLEQILREDDDDDDEEGDLKVWNNMENPAADVLSRGDTRTVVYTATSTSVSSHNEKVQKVSTTHTAEDWAVLQALLGEDNDDEDDDDDDFMASLNHHGKYMGHKQDVDAILLSDDEGEQGSSTPLHVHQLPLRPQTNGHSHLSTTTVPSVHPTVSSPPRKSKDLDASSPFTLSPIRTPTSPNKSSILPDIWSLGHEVIKFAQGAAGLSPTTNSIMPDSAYLEEISKRALLHAQNYERKLLKAGHRDIVSPLMIKRRLKQKIELGTRIQRERQLALATGGENNAVLSSQKFGFSGLVENRSMQGINAGMKPEYLRQRGIKAEVGLPTSLAVNSKFIAVGTQRGLVLVFDLYEVLKQVLNAASTDDWNPKNNGAITSIDFNMNDEILVAGYTSGVIVLWDTIKGCMLRNVSETHPSPISSVQFLSDLKMVTVDAGGLVNKLTFSKNMLWSTYSMETECLLDGTAGQILAMSVLPPIQSHEESAAQLPMRHITLIALSSERSSFAVAVEPAVSVLHRWAKPPQERIDAIVGSSAVDSQHNVLPCLSWGWSMVSGGGNSLAPILARAWGCSVQLLLASFPTLENRGQNSVVEGIQWPAFGLHGEFDVDVPVVALEWLNKRSLVYLTVTNEFTVVDTVMMTLLERLDFSGFKLVYAEFSLSRGSMDSIDDNSEPREQYCSTFQNSIKSSDQRLLVLCQEEVKIVSIVGTKRRISALEEDGEWLEALAVALDHYENTISSQEDRRRLPDGRKDLSRHPEFSTAKSDDEEWIARLLLRYLNLAVENAPESPVDEHGIPSVDASQSILDLAQSHYQMLAGVCVEFCVVTKRLDLLFGQIFRRFHSVGFTPVFLDVLEPYVLNDKLAYISPEVMTFFVERCKQTSGIATVERCLLHMDVTIMDFDSIVSLLRKHEMYTALFYVFNQGLNDYITPLEILLEKLFDAADNGNGILSRRKDGVPQNEFERLGYKAILYVRTCFEGKVFPQGTDMLPEDAVSSVQAELLRFLANEVFTPSQQVQRGVGGEPIGYRALRFPYTHILLVVDAKAMLDSIELCLETPGFEFSHETSRMESINGWEVEVAVDLAGSQLRSGSQDGSKKCPDMQDIITLLSAIILPDKSDHSMAQSSVHKSEGAVNAYLDFLATYIMKGVARVSSSITFMILTRMAKVFSSAREIGARQHAQRQILDMLTALPRYSYEPDEVLNLVDSAGIHRAALLLHQEGATWNQGRSTFESRCHHFCKAIDCYIGDDDVSFRKEVFQYVKKECSSVTESNNRQGSKTAPNSLRGALAKKLRDLVFVDALLTAELVAELFVDDIDRVTAMFEGDDGGRAQFMFLRVIESGELSSVNPVAGSVLNANLRMEHHHKYLALMARLHPDMVYEYLSTHDNYRPEECLRLCQEHDIADASAYLLERMGNVSSALQLILQTLESRMMVLKRTIRGMGLDRPRHPVPMYKRSDLLLSELTGKREKDVDAVQRTLNIALDLCERNSTTSSVQSEHGSQLWFNVLDRLINAKGFLRLSKEQPQHADAMALVLSDLLRQTMQRMVSSVPLSDLVRKVTSDHSGSRLGELREMIESLLSTYGFELNVFGGAAKVFHHDTQALHRANSCLRREGGGVLNVMQNSLDDIGRNASSNTDIFLERTMRDGSILKFSDPGVVTFANDRQSDLSSNENGLANAMSRLRSRRHKTTEAKVFGRARASGLSFMTEGEQSYIDDPSANAGIEASVGCLGEAQHRGRLMSFIQ